MMSNVTMLTENLPNIPWQDKPEGYVGPVWRYSENPIVNRNFYEQVMLKAKTGI